MNVKLLGHRPGLPGNEISVLLCPLTRHGARIAGHLPAKAQNGNSTLLGLILIEVEALSDSI